MDNNLLKKNALVYTKKYPNNCATSYSFHAAAHPQYFKTLQPWILGDCLATKWRLSPRKRRGNQSLTIRWSLVLTPPFLADICEQPLFCILNNVMALYGAVIRATWVSHQHIVFLNSRTRKKIIFFLNFKYYLRSFQI